MVGETPLVRVSAVEMEGCKQVHFYFAAGPATLCGCIGVSLAAALLPCTPLHPHPPPQHTPGPAPHPNPLQAAPTFGLFSTAEGGAAYVARDLLDISSHIFKPEVRLLPLFCLSRNFGNKSLAELTASLRASGRAQQGTQGN